MIYKETQIETKEIEVIKDIVCNMCGKSCMEGTTEITENYSTNISISGGYFSPVLTDGVTYEFDLCERCVYDIMQKLKIPATNTDELMS